KKHHMLKDSPMESPAKAKKWTLINNYGDKTLLRNLIAFEISRQLRLPYTVWGQPVDVILNGEYKGCYQLCDQITTDKARVPITDMEPTDEQEPELTGGYLLEIDGYGGQEKSMFYSSHGTPVTIKSPDEDDITTSQHNYIKDYFNDLEYLVWSNQYTDPVKGYRSKLDLTSWLKYFLLEELTGNTDAYHSTYIYKERDSARFVVSPGWDFDLGFNNDNRYYPVDDNDYWNTLTRTYGAGDMINFVKRIFSDPETWKQASAIWAEARSSGTFSPETMLHYIDSMALLTKASADLNFKRWPILDTRVHQNPVALGSVEAELNVVREYVKGRIEWMDEMLGYAHTHQYADSTYYISTPAELAHFAYAVRKGGKGSTAYLTSDIDMTGVTMGMIGTVQRPFCGTFDGQGHTISNLHIEGGNNCGLFGTITDGAVISNFILDSASSIHGLDYVGVVGVAKGEGVVTIRNVGNEATITGGRNAAGILGCNFNAELKVVIQN
ncbi:MAG: CotH kinase family protein, partial [Bacteroidaceae bacterium]|nr:CotH kinase family protein [Bacteroidaceae bacterium]